MTDLMIPAKFSNRKDKESDYDQDSSQSQGEFQVEDRPVEGFFDDMFGTVQ